MVTETQLQRVCGRVNLRIARGSITPNDKILLIELAREGIEECELGIPDDSHGTWYWPVFNNGTWFVQYASGRCTVIRNHSVPETRSPVMYAEGNPKTKKQLREWVESGKRVAAFQPGGIFPSQTDGSAAIEGPHYPKPHRWYAQVILKDGYIVEVKK
jgi:hypothetical protein